MAGVCPKDKNINYVNVSSLQIRVTKELDKGMKSNEGNRRVHERLRYEINISPSNFKVTLLLNCVVLTEVFLLLITNCAKTITQ